MTDYEIKICRGSSMEEVAKRLMEESSLAIGVTESMKIVITHKTSHWDILEDSGIPECDFIMLGNISLGVGLYEHNGRNAVVRIKANEFWEQEEEIGRAVDDFCRPLAEKFRSRR